MSMQYMILKSLDLYRATDSSFLCIISSSILQYDERTHGKDESVALHIQRFKDAALAHPQPPSESSQVETFRPCAFDLYQRKARHLYCSHSTCEWFS